MKYFTPVVSLFFGLLLFFIANYTLRNFNPSELGLGKNTTSHIARMNGVVMSGIAGDADSVLLAIRSVKYNNGESTDRHLAVWIGNSQLHAINKYEDGDLLAIQYGQLKLKELNANLSLFQFSAPHLNMVEELIYLNTLRVQKVIPDYLIIPITFRSFHFIKIRDELKTLSGYNGIAKTINSPRIAEIYSAEERNDERGKLVSKQITLQERSEHFIDSTLSRIPYFKYRENTKTYVKFLPTLALRMMTDKNKDPEVSGNHDIIEINKQALNEVVKFAEDNKVKIVLYKVPHPQDSQYFFYDRKAYDDFFDEIFSILDNKKNIHLIKLDSIVPIRLWGINNDGYRDTYHFQAEGHKILGDTIARYLHHLNKAL